MEGSEHRIRKLIRTAVPIALLGAAVVAGGCGGGGSDTAKTSAPVTQKSASSGGVVTAEGTVGLVGPAGRATAKSHQFEDKSSRISPKANQKTKAQKHGVGTEEACNDGGLMPDNGNLAQLNASIICLVNAERTDNGNLPQLTESSQLDQAASGMCQRMVTEQFFSHETPDGKDVVDRIQPTGYIPNSGDWVVGENLAWGSGALSTPQAIVNGWMNSPGHRANILAPDYKDIGLAACIGPPSPDLSGGAVYVNNFGAKSGADVNVKLPPEGGNSNSSGSGQADLASVAGTKAAASKKKATKTRAKRRRACVRRASKIKNKKRRHAVVSRCRRKK